MQYSEQPPRQPLNILGYTFKLFGKTFTSHILLILITFGLSLVSLLPALGNMTSMMALSTSLEYVQDPMAILPGILASSLSTIAVSLLVSVLSSVISYAMYYVSRAGALSEDTSVGAAFKLAFSKIGSIIGQTLLFAVLMGAIALIALVIPILILGLGAANENAIMVLLGVLLYLVVLVLIVIFSIRLSLYTFVNVFEDTWYIDSLKRSWSLAKGNMGRMFGYTLLFSLILSFAIIIVMMVTLVPSIAMGSANEVAGTAGMVVSMVVTAVLASLFTPLSVCLTVALGLSCKERNEGMVIPTL